MKGKGIFLWQFDRVGDGSKEAVLAALQEGGFQRVDIKVGSGAYLYARNDKPEYFDYLKQHGIQVYGYGFCYGYNAPGEGWVAAEAIDKYNLDGYILDVEGKFEKWDNCIVRAKQLMRNLRTEQPDIDVALCTWPLFRNPKTGSRWHNADLAIAFMSYCQIAMPMIYWGHYGDTVADALDWLEWTLQQWREFTHKPIIPTGRAYVDGWEGHITLRPEAVEAFGKRVRELELQGESWWELGWATTRRPDVWEVLKALPAWANGEGSEPDPGEHTLTLTDEERDLFLKMAEQLHE